jgi:hypothetical protein
MIKGIFEEIFYRSGELSTHASTVVTKVMETILRYFPVEGHHLFVNVLNKMAVVIMEDKEHSVLMTAYLSIFARVLLNDPAFFMQFLGSGTHDLRVAFIDKWIDKVDSIGQPSQLKLTAFALCSLLKTSDDEILKLLPGIINVCLNVHFQLDRSSGSEVDGFERDE